MPFIISLHPLSSLSVVRHLYLYIYILARTHPIIILRLRYRYKKRKEKQQKARNTCTVEYSHLLSLSLSKYSLFFFCRVLPTRLRALKAVGRITDRAFRLKIPSSYIYIFSSSRSPSSSSTLMASR